MDSIGKYNGDNFGGIVSFQFIPLYYLSSIPEAIDGNVASDIVLVEGAQIGTLPFTLGQGKYIEQEKQSGDGSVYSQSIEINIPHDRPEISSWKKKYKNIPGVCLILKTDGQVKIIGTKEEPMKFITNATSGRVFSDRDGMDMSFKGVTLDPSPFYTNMIEIDPYSTYQGNDLYVEAGETLTMDGDMFVKDLLVNGTQDGKRIISNGYTIYVYGYMAGYIGSYPDHTLIGTSSGSAGWLEDVTIVVKGKARSFIDKVTSPFTANTRSAGWHFIVDPDDDEIIIINDTMRCHSLDVRGHLETGIEEVREGGYDYESTPGNLQPNEGLLIVRNGAFFKTSDIHKGSNTAVGFAVASITVEEDGILSPQSSAQTFAARSFDIQGVIRIDGGFVIPSNHDGITDAIPLTEFGKLWINAVATVTLAENTTLTKELRFILAGVLNLNGNTLSYDTDCDIYIDVNKTLGDEIPDSGSGTAIPRNAYVADGATWNLGGKTVNIRGTITLGVGAATTNGTLNENQI